MLSRLRLALSRTLPQLILTARQPPKEVVLLSTLCRKETKGG